MTEHESTTVSMPTYVLRLLLIGPIVIGAVLGVAARPVVEWLTGLIGGAPGPLRLVAGIPVHWSVVVLSVAGLVVGVLLSESTKEDTLRVTVAADHVDLAIKKENRRIARDAVHGVVKEGHDLLLVDADEGTLARYPAKDLDEADLAAAFTDRGYPWRGADDPASAEFTRWVEGDAALTDEVHRLLARRARAIADDATGDAANLADDLRDAGVIVRDRDGVQHHRPR